MVVMALAGHFRSHLPWLGRVSVQPVVEEAPDDVLQVALGDHRTSPSPALARAMTLPVPDPAAEQTLRDTQFELGQNLARQERWKTLAQALSKADQNREKTLCGTPYAALIAFGARADIVMMARDALSNGEAPDPEIVNAGVHELETILGEYADEPYVAVILALTHIDVGTAWKENARQVMRPRKAEARFAAHIERAAELLDRIDAREIGSPLIASAKCALTSGGDLPASQLIEQFEVWIDLDPRDMEPYRRLGHLLLTGRQANRTLLERTARQLAARTADVWGAGAYAFVLMDAAASDVLVLGMLDATLFVDGLRNALRLGADPYIANMLAAYCACRMNLGRLQNEAAFMNQREIATSIDWIVRDHLRQVHPLVWAEASAQLDEESSAEHVVANGYAEALRVLSDVFRREPSLNPA